MSVSRKSIRTNIMSSINDDNGDYDDDNDDDEKI